MRVLLYEWCCSGGLAGADAPIAREGRMMLEALATDAAKTPSHEVAVLVETGRPVDLPRETSLLPVRHGDDTAALVAAARYADWTLVVAPETDGILLERVRAVRAAGCRVLAPADRVIELATDKQATIDALAARGAPVPAGRVVAAGEPIPPGFRLPAVRKSRAGCGGEGLRIIRSPGCPPATEPARLETLVPGVPVGVSCICGIGTTLVLPPLRQRFSAGDTPRYQGSDLLADKSQALRATALASRAAAAVGADAGWLGVDMILGDHPGGRDDRILEVNPRVTTSFVAHARLYASSLVAAMIDAAAGLVPHAVPAVDPGPDAGGFRLPDA